MIIKSRLSCVEPFFSSIFSLVFLVFVSLMMCVPNHKDMIVIVKKKKTTTKNIYDCNDVNYSENMNTKEFHSKVTLNCFH